MISISLRPSERKWSTVSFASTLHLYPVLDVLLASVPSQWQAEIRLGLQEALVNASKHGNKLDPSKAVVVRYGCLGNEHLWVISDQGQGFEQCSSTCNPCFSPPLQDIGECGRGLYILHQIFDDVCWNRMGNELTLTKRFNERWRFPSVD